MTLSTDDRNYLILGNVGETCFMIEEEDDDEEFNAEECLAEFKAMTDEQLLNATMIDFDDEITPAVYYDRWSNFVPHELNYLDK